MMRMGMLLPSLHPLFSIYNDGGHDDVGDGDDDDDSFHFIDNFLTHHNYYS